MTEDFIGGLDSGTKIPYAYVLVLVLVLLLTSYCK